MIQYRYQLEKYRGRSTRHVCPQCGRKSVFTRYIDTENNNTYINDNVGECNRLDKCGYHYTPHQYFTDNPWKRDNFPREGEVVTTLEEEECCCFVANNREKQQSNSNTSSSSVQEGLCGVATSGIALLAMTEHKSSFRLQSALFYIKYPISLDKRFDIVI